MAASIRVLNPPAINGGPFTASGLAVWSRLLTVSRPAVLFIVGNTMTDQANIHTHTHSYTHAPHQTPTSMPYSSDWMLATWGKFQWNSVTTQPVVSHELINKSKSTRMIYYPLKVGRAAGMFFVCFFKISNVMRHDYWSHQMTRHDV